MESVSLSDLATTYGTPLYVYSKNTLLANWQCFASAFGDYPHLICYAVKANSNLAILNQLARLGSGFDIVSGGELMRVIKAGGDANKVVFSGVGKQAEEIKLAIEYGIKCFNVESEEELLQINRIAGEMNTKAPISLRVNPDIDAQTHPYITTGSKDNKFGIATEIIRSIYTQANNLPNIDILGIDCHIGSRINNIKPFQTAMKNMVQLTQTLRDDGINIQHLDIGGGLDIDYHTGEPVLKREQYVAELLKLCSLDNISLIIEPGRSIVGDAGVLLTQVIYLKQTSSHHFAIVDAGMNDLIRPALYQSWHDIKPVRAASTETATQIYDIVGPICETGDFLAKNREFYLQTGDFLAIYSVGAYGFVMSSNYNTRSRAAEVMVDHEVACLIRERESTEALMANENILP